jgi:phage FluMu gp28-like protein
MTQLYKMIRLTLPPGLSEQSPADRTAWMERWIAEHVKPVIATFDREKPSYFGQDFARSNDLSVIMAGQYSDDSVLQCMLNIEMKGIYFELQKQLLRAICDAMPQFTAGFMDASGNGADIAEFMEGIFGKSHITCIKATEATYHAMMPRVKRRIEDQTIAMPRDEGVIYDLRMVRMKNGTPRVIDRNTTLINGTKSRRHGDTAIALMHLVGAADVAEHVGKVMAIRRGPLPYDGFVNGVP